MSTEKPAPEEKTKHESIKEKLRAQIEEAEKKLQEMTHSLGTMGEHAKAALAKKRDELQQRLEQHKTQLREHESAAEPSQQKEQAKEQKEQPK